MHSAEGSVVDHAARRLASSAGLSLAWIPSRCLLPAPWNIDCHACRDACPESALEVADAGQGLQLRATDACTNCNECLPACDSEALTSASTALSRRQLLRRAVSPEPARIDPADAAPAPRRRWRLEAAGNTAEPEQPITHPRVVLDATRCDASGLCSRLCPTGALLDDASAVLRFDSHYCLGCGQCETVCPSGAIRLESGHAPARIDLRRAEPRACSECGHGYQSVAASTADDEDWARLPLCPACRRDQSLMRSEVMSLLR